MHRLKEKKAEDMFLPNFHKLTHIYPTIRYPGFNYIKPIPTLKAGKYRNSIRGPISETFSLLHRKSKLMSCLNVELQLD